MPRDDTNGLAALVPAAEPLAQQQSRHRLLLVFDENYSRNGYVVFAAIRHVQRQLAVPFDCRVVVRGKYDGPRFGWGERVRIRSRAAVAPGMERRLGDRLRRKLARFHVLEAADRWTCNLGAAERLVLREMFDAARLHAVIVFTADPAYGLTIARLAHLYADRLVPHLVVVTPAGAIDPATAADLRWLRVRVLRDARNMPSRLVPPRESQPMPPRLPEGGGITDLLAVSSMFDASAPFSFLDPESFPSHDLRGCETVCWLDWIGPHLPLPERVRHVVLFFRPDWMACGSGTLFESVAHWFRAQGALLIDVAIWPYAVKLRPEEAERKLIEEQDSIGAALYFSLRCSNSVPYLLRRLAATVCWAPRSIIRQTLALHARAAKPHIMREAIRRARITHIYVNHYFTLDFARDLIAGRTFFLDTHDIQAVNHVHIGARNRLTRRGDRFTRLLREEMSLAARAAQLGFVNRDEMGVAARFIPADRLSFIIPLPEIRACPPKALGRPPQLLIVASNNRHNEQNLHWFAGQVLPALGTLLRQSGQQSMAPQIHLCGEICSVLPPTVTRLFKTHGFVPDLRSVYEATDLVLLPVVAGAGLAIKTLEALLYEKPVVATSHALRGLPNEVAAAVGYENDPGAFAAAIVRLLGSQESRDRSRECTRLGARLLREQRFYERLKQAMDAVRL